MNNSFSIKYIRDSIFVLLFLMSFFLILIFASCKKFVEVDSPVTSVTEESAFSNDATAISTVTSIYAKLSTAGATSVGFPSMSRLIAGLASDELTLWSGVTNVNLIAYYRNSYSAVSNTGGDIWNDSYKYLFTCNAAISGLSSSTSLTPSIRTQLLGEAKFMRAFIYFYLVNYYGDVPLVLTTDYRVNSILTRTSKADVYQQIIADLLDAQNLLSSTYLDGSLINGSTDRVRPTKWAATALLARVYLLLEDWANAEIQSNNVISQSSLFGLPTLDNAFLKNSQEAIWQLQPVNMSGSLFWNTEDGKVFTLTLAPAGPSTSHPIYLSTSLINAFETKDNRKTSWIGTFTNSSGTFKFPTKYKSASANTSISEYWMVLRLAEQYLIRAESRAQLDKIISGRNDLNTIRTRAGEDSSLVNDKSSLVNAIIHERQVELFTEWGHRWIDLKRTGKIDSIMSVIKPLKANGDSWQSYMQMFPVPSNEILKNQNLSQNSGY